jgi:hypothetical protein
MKLTAETTVFNDDKVQEKFAELVVDADGIRTEVGKKVGNTEVISRINQSAESVKIQADKINIDGVITAVNDNTATTIDGDKITTGTIGADRIKVDEIEIGAAQIASGTIDTARIPNLSAEKITTGTISIARIPSTARNDTYITDIGSDGIRVHDSHTSNNAIVINSNGMEVFKGGTTDPYSVAKYGDSARIGKAASKHISIDATNGMQVFTGTESDSTNVAQLNDTARIGKKAGTNIQISDSAVSFYNNKEYVSLSPNTAQNVGGCRLQTYYYNSSGTKVNSYGFTLDGNGMRIRSGTDDLNYHTFLTTGYSTRGSISVYGGLHLSANNEAIYCTPSSGSELDVLHLDNTNTLVIGYGLWKQNTSGYDTYLEGYDVYLRARNKCYSNGSQITTSDKRLKKDIVPISDKFKQLFMDLQPVEYRMEQSKDKDIHLGLTAQDVEMAFMKNNISADKYAIVDEYSYPEEKTRYKALAYTEFIPLCIKMIQSQQEEINILKGEVNALRSN